MLFSTEFQFALIDEIPFGKLGAGWVQWESRCVQSGGGGGGDFTRDPAASTIRTDGQHH
jgi:hypothetical protein